MEFQTNKIITPAASNVLRLKSEIKADLISHFDAVKADVDISSQLILSNNSLKSSTRAHVTEINKKLIDQIEKMYENNNTEVNNYFTNMHIDDIKLIDKEDGKRLLFKSYCTFIGNEILNSELRYKHPLGLYIVTDWYMDEGQLNYLKYLFVRGFKNKNLNKIDYVFDENIFLIAFGLTNTACKIPIHLKKQDLIDKISKLEVIELNFEKDFKHFGSIKASSLVNFTNIEGLILNGNPLIDESVFSYLEKLKSFVFSNFSDIDAINNVFGALNKSSSRVEKLLLRNFSMKNLPVKAFEHLTHLKDLCLGQNEELTEILNGWFYNLVNLQTLVLSNDKIEKIEPGSFDRLTNLKELYLHDNNLKTFDSNLFKDLVNLEFLQLSGNNLTEIPHSAFKTLAKLKHLILYENSLTKLGVESFIGLENLQKLELGNNEIDLIEPGTFNPLKNLFKLDLSSNHLKDISANLFSELSELKVLVIRENFNLKELNQNCFNGLANLIKLDLQECDLQTINDNVFVPLINLKELVLLGNDLNDLKDNVFDGLANLAVLDLSNQAKMKNINERIFTRLTSLETLFLSFNHFTKIKSKMFFGLSNLKNLDLSSCKIGTIEKDGLIGLDNLRNLNMKRNKLFRNSSKKKIDCFSRRLRNFYGVPKLKKLMTHCENNIVEFARESEYKIIDDNLISDDDEDNKNDEEDENMITNAKNEDDNQDWEDVEDDFDPSELLNSMRPACIQQ